MWGKGGKAGKVGIVLGCIYFSVFLAYLVMWGKGVEILEGFVVLAAVLAATLIAGLIYWVLLGLGWAVVYGAIKGSINEVKKFLKS